MYIYTHTCYIHARVYEPPLGLTSRSLNSSALSHLSLEMNWSCMMARCALGPPNAINARGVTAMAIYNTTTARGHTVKHRHQTGRSPAYHASTRGFATGKGHIVDQLSRDLSACMVMHVSMVRVVHVKWTTCPSRLPSPSSSSVLGLPTTHIDTSTQEASTHTRQAFSSPTSRLLDCHV